LLGHIKKGWLKKSEIFSAFPSSHPKRALVSSQEMLHKFIPEK
jgi:hypothetical protein